ncbi:hypothetical protein V8G54_006935 [Vigna mungo]|uniref:Uncharacterized protein n=1 Tax=Vigna mungo TaxID=3915 RepID=A0AAQ3P4E6_VIGMU
MDRRKSSGKTTASKASTVEASPSISVSEAFIVNALCVIGLAFAFWAANTVFSIDLVSHPSLTLFLISIAELPIVILLYSRYRLNPQQCSKLSNSPISGNMLSFYVLFSSDFYSLQYLRAVGRGVLGVPVGAIALGAPVKFQYVKVVTSQYNHKAPHGGRC